MVSYGRTAGGTAGSWDSLLALEVLLAGRGAGTSGGGVHVAALDDLGACCGGGA
ncbi:hypothetical protein TRIUR3_25246 [Triticum urartu]|uniref:Uncharacterized protein n=1 Tax=Triticum urartu TaxID=4572 RepID=M7ZJ37_TRIUA|nr:hypothetical protein TRIUR3_25246 [Triticum urartu]